MIFDPFTTKVCPACQVALVQIKGSASKGCPAYNSCQCPISFRFYKNNPVYLSTTLYDTCWYIDRNNNRMLSIYNIKSSLSNSPSLIFPFSVEDLSSATNLNNKINLLLSFQ